MEINPSAASLIAGVSRAAAKGGENDKQVNEARQRQTTASEPGGKSEGSIELDAGEQTGDRGTDGRQVLDVFERSDEEKSQDDPEPKIKTNPEPDGHLDLEA